MIANLTILLVSCLCILYAGLNAYARIRADGLIFDGAFTSTFRALTGRRLIPWDKFDNYARLPKIECPVLIIHGTLDRTVPFSHALKNWNAIPGPKQRLFVEGAHHGNVVELAGRDYWNIVMHFIQRNP